MRSILVTASIVMNLGLLAVFKYMPFFLENWAACQRPARARMALDAAAEPLLLRFSGADLHHRPVSPRRQRYAQLPGPSGRGLFFPHDSCRADHACFHVDRSVGEAQDALDAAEGGRALFLIALGLDEKAADRRLFWARIW